MNETMQALLTRRSVRKYTPQMPKREDLEQIIEAEPLAKIDYVKMVDFENIVQIEQIEDRPILCAMAVYIGKTRLIDNFIFDPSTPDGTLA